MKQVLMRLLNMTIGLLLTAFGIILTIKANIGYAPWEVFHVGLSKTIGLSFGMTTILVGVVIVIIVTLLGEKLGLGTILSMVLTGVFADIILIVNIIPMENDLMVGLIMLIAGLFIISLGTYFYIKTAYGVGPRDNLMVVLARKTKLPVGVCRCLVEFFVTFIGWLLGGMVGIGTIISVIAIGFCIQITFGLFKFDVTAVKYESFTESWLVLCNRYRKREVSRKNI
ncbi:MAG: hypothetical protein LBE79_00710 [Tannerella sp.]|jgi:uncharacterized membrane protein YczE|nr:hypothetical protein [Tannerella sp.]